jgi:hypothetical protein
MKLLSVAVVSLAVFAASPSASAAALASRQELEVKVDANRIDDYLKALWDRFGAFCQIAEWHPAVRSCSEGKEGDATLRNLSLQDGEKIKEKLLSSGPLIYSYSIVESPLPVKNYEAKFSITPDEGDKDGIDIVWSATYDAADGKSDGDARAAIDGIFRDGIDSIKSKLPKGVDATAKTDAPEKNGNGGKN